MTTTGLVLPQDARLVAGGLGFAEGPALLDIGEVAVVSINRGIVYAVELDGAVREVVETGGEPNCVAAGPDGELWINQNGGTAMPSKSAIPTVPSIQCLRDGVLTTVVSEGLNSPSDCEIGPDGRLWFTDPVGHMDSSSLGSPRSMDTTTFEVTTVRDDMRCPNGLAFGVSVGATSACFAGPDLGTPVLTIAKGGSVVALPTPHPGLPVPVRSGRTAGGAYV